MDMALERSGFREENGEIQLDLGVSKKSGHCTAIKSLAMALFDIESRRLRLV